MDESAQLQWQCRRGMLELDLLLKNYLDNGYLIADDNEKARFAKLLALDDGELLALMLSDSMAAGLKGG